MADLGEDDNESRDALHGLIEDDSVVAEWVADVAQATDGARSRALLTAYHDLGSVVLRLAAEAGPGEDVLSTAEPNDARALSRAIASVAADVRRSSLTITDALTDTGILWTSALSSLRRRAEKDGRAMSLETTLLLARSFRAATRRLVRALESTSLRAERERTEALVAMADQLSHELRNRLGAARTASQMLFTPDIELDHDGLKRVGELVQSSVEAALRTVDDVRELVASRVNQHERQTRTIPLARLVRGVIDDLSPSALEVGVELRVEGEPLDCLVDAGRLRLIVFNLVGNGIKYRDRAKRESHVTTTTHMSSDGEVELSVSDNGVGILPEDIDDIFLHHGRGSETDGVPGSGLGLAIVREAVEQIGGEIRVTSRVGGGSRFVVTFQPMRSDGE